VFDIKLENGFDFLSEEYRQLFEKSDATAFQHPLWLDALYRVLAPKLKAEPMVLTARRRQTGALAMLLPLMRRRRGGLRVIEFADLEVSDYAAPICDAAAFAELAADRLACERVRARLRPYDLLRVKKLSNGALPLERLLGTGERSRMDMSTHAVRLSDPFSQWQVENIVHPYRRELEKKRRKLNRRGAVQFDCWRDPKGIKAALQAIQAHRKERFPDDLLQQSAYFDFYLDVALRGAESGFARTYTLSLDGEPIGGAFGLEHRRRFLVLLSGADLADYKRYSVGALTFEDVARDCIERKDEVLDFTLGDEAYKQRFGAQPSSMWTISAGATASGKLAVFVADKAPWVRKMTGDMGARRAATPFEYAD
jgi:CelD/BcsL family acetyltransferase involved in cellulose biosynthesis